MKKKVLPQKERNFILQNEKKLPSSKGKKLQNEKTFLLQKETKLQNEKTFLLQKEKSFLLQKERNFKRRIPIHTTHK